MTLYPKCSQILVCVSNINLLPYFIFLGKGVCLSLCSVSAVILCVFVSVLSSCSYPVIELLFTFFVLSLYESQNVCWVD